MFSKKLFTDDIVLISLGQVKKTYVLIVSRVFKKEEEARHFFFFFEIYFNCFIENYNDIKNNLKHSLVYCLILNFQTELRYRSKFVCPFTTERACQGIIDLQYTLVLSKHK